MRSATTFLFALPLLVAARSHVKDITIRQNLPDCYFTCAAAGDMGDCSSTDNTCLCKNQSFIDSVTSCLQKTCSSDEVETANAGAQEICKSVGVTLTSSAPSSTSDSASPSSTSTSDSNNSSTSDDDSDSDNNGAVKTGTGALAGLVGVAVVALAL
ncbi:hypothetical protein EV715DRAFT_257538 [Schizophyllum commune]